jgi:hypothetical protein
MSALTADRVEAIFADCLAPGADGVTVEGIVGTAVFDQDALTAWTADICALLAELPDQYRKSGGGGWSFLNACDDRHGNQWTGFHRTMEHLFMLGLGIGKVELLMPRELWDALPGGMPYYAVDVTA